MEALRTGRSSRKWSCRCCSHWWSCRGRLRTGQHLRDLCPRDKHLPSMLSDKARVILPRSSCRAKNMIQAERRQPVKLIRLVSRDTRGTGRSYIPFWPIPSPSPIPIQPKGRIGVGLRICNRLVDFRGLGRFEDIVYMLDKVVTIFGGRLRARVDVHIDGDIALILVAKIPPLAWLGSS